MADSDDDLIELVLDDVGDKMDKAVTHTRHEFSTVRTGRASSALVEKLPVDYYGAEVPLQQIANFSVPEARLLVITPFDKGSVNAIEKAIRESDLGLNPTNDGHVVRLAFPRSDRGAAQGPGAPGAGHGRRGQDRAAQPAPRRPSRAGGPREVGGPPGGRPQAGREGAGRHDPRPRGEPSPVRWPTRRRSFSMSDDRPDEGAPSDPRPSGRIRIVGASPATGEHPTVAAQRPPSDPQRPPLSPLTLSPLPPSHLRSRTRTASGPSRSSPTTTSRWSTPRRPGPRPRRPRPRRKRGPSPSRRSAPRRTWTTWTCPRPPAVPVVPSEPTPAPARDLDDIRVWAAPDDEDEASRSKPVARPTSTRSPTSSVTLMTAWTTSSARPRTTCRTGVSRWPVPLTTMTPGPECPAAPVGGARAKRPVSRRTSPTSSTTRPVSNPWGRTR